MRLSVIIVSYNVRFFLEQCLTSVRAAIRGPLTGVVEVIIMDNASTDGTLHFLRPLFPAFTFIANSENSGFARGNNKALSRAAGEYVLFLNPDTILPEDALQKALAFLTAHPATGAAGFRMIDGRGIFLPESKRGFPAPAASFYKMTGLASLFPRSPVFAAYYAGSPDVDQVREIDILSGACMIVRRSVLEKTGGFDERFFMYAEDIDLSWRIRLAGYNNIYLADITIIHFKGESTRRDGKYVRLFYKAMHQFRDKYGTGKDGPGEWMLRAAIGFRELVAMGAVLIRKEGPGRKSAGSRPSTNDHKQNAAVGARSEVRPSSQNKNPATTDEYILLGDPANAALIHQALHRSGLKEAEQAGRGSMIIFCEGPGLSWKNIISAIAGEDPQRECLVHGQDSHALVGSPARGRQGRVFFLNG